MAESKEFEELLEHANALIERDQAKNHIQAEMLRMHRLEWGEKLVEKGTHVRETRDTQPWDAVRTSVDILSVHEPTITIELPREQPEEETAAPTLPDNLDPFTEYMMDMGAPADSMQALDPGVFGMDGAPTIEGMAAEGMGQPGGEEYNPIEIGETLEGMVRSALQHNDQRRKSPLLRDMLTSCFLFDEVIAKVADMRHHPAWATLPEAMKRLSPFKINACLPMTVHTEWDDFGLAGVLHRYKRSMREIKQQYGDVNEAVQLFDADPEGNVIFCEWWTREDMCQWIERSAVKSDEKTLPSDRTQNELVLRELAPHGYGFVPYVVGMGSGSGMFETEGDQIAPMLYGGWKSATFFRANLFLSVVATLAAAQANPKWIYGSETGEKTIELNFNYPEVIPARQGEEITKLDVGVNEDLLRMMQEFTSRSERTTISTVASGQVPQGVSAAAAINLLVQGTKLTIVPAQNAVGKVYSGVANMLFEYTKLYGEGIQVMAHGGVKKIDPAQIPAWLDVKVTLRADLPQDKALLYNVALNAWKQGFISRKTGWDMVGIEDTVKEEERLDMEMQQATMEQMQAGKLSEPAQQAMMAEQQQQQLQAQQGAEANVGDATTAAMSEGLPVEQNPQAGGGVIDQLNAMQNAIANPMG